MHVGYEAKNESDINGRGLVMFIFALGVTLSSYRIETEYEGIIGKMGLTVNSLADREIFESSKVENTRKRYSRLRSILQHIGTCR